MILSSRIGRAAAGFVLGLLVASGGAWAAVNETDGVAIKGYDPVAYFTEHKPVHGDAKFTAQFDGATYWFHSAANQARFQKDPAHFIPQYDGFCAYGAAEGHKADIDPTAFSIVGDRLYLNYNAEVKTTWRKDIPGYIAKADKNWPEVSKSTDVIH